MRPSEMRMQLLQTNAGGTLGGWQDYAWDEDLGSALQVSAHDPFVHARPHALPGTARMQTAIGIGCKSSPLHRT